MSVIEASCLGLAVICSDAYGMADTMVEGMTGLRCKIGDAESLFEAMKILYEEPDLRTKMGQEGRTRVLELFAADKIVGAWVDFYHELLFPTSMNS